MTYKKSEHFDGKKFFNPNGPELKSFFAVLKWQLTKDKASWPSVVPIKNYPLRMLAPNEKYTATFINHSTFLIQFQGLNVLTDPVYSQRVSPFSFLGPKRVKEPGVPFDSLPPIDVVLVSHNHYDHMDIETLKKLDGKFHPLFLVPLGDEKYLKTEGLQNVKEMDWWEEVKVKETTFTFAPALHWSARWIGDKNDSLWGSFMLNNEKAKIYFAGDTGLGDHFGDIKSRLGAPDLALLPIGAYKPEWFMLGHHMGPEQAVEAHLRLGAAKSVAMHFGTFQLSDEGMLEPQEDLNKAKIKHQVPEGDFILLEQGQEIFN